MQADDWKDEALQVLQQVVEHSEAFWVFAAPHVVERAELRSLQN